MKLRRRWDILRMRVRSLARRRRVEEDLDKELRFHLERQLEENLAAGMPPPKPAAQPSASWVA